ncbi:nucleotide-binding universal stress UspA family protein [Pontibacter mucosus]|uniref:Nucleotide-binding universal stress UspA family protein n=1 Tax=Pontibacter mucosus TaxID=1649266 RepID=A0A2T5YHK6_9BACT|nr:universal stress protein [Pontibacter mucosus]PTX18797.1 nucleotide-binding universal stress UspA family protein [Pontibacter mucosus]
MNKILCPTDFSGTSDKAVEYAVHIAQHAGAHLTLLHVVHLPIVDTSETALVASELLGEQMRNATDKLKATVLHLEETYGANRDGGFTCDFLVKEALLTDVAKQLSKQENYDLIVMGTTGCDSTMEELLIGSNTEAVMEEVKCPVLSVPRDAAPAKVERIVYASDYSEEDIAAMREVVQLGSCFGAKIDVVHIVKKPGEQDGEEAAAFRLEMQGLFPDVPLTFQELVNRHRDEGLMEFYNQAGGDVLAMVRREKGFLKSLFTQSLAERMTYQAKVPLLILHGKK